MKSNVNNYINKLMKKIYKNTPKIVFIKNKNGENTIKLKSK